MELDLGILCGFRDFLELEISETVYDPPSKIVFRFVKICLRRVLSIHGGRICIILWLTC